ncbi:MAG TPA: hypothetical protein VN436_11820, partial [Holophaga sp.]|nr:hypothetical protein [Holophaga sp.]
LSITTQVLGNQASFSPELLDLLAVSLAETGRFPEACAVLEKALAQSKDRKEGWVPDLEKRLALFRKGQPFREARPS